MEARILLEGDEREVPGAVERTRAHLEQAGVWHHLARNRPALSCRDAAAKRRRLGHEGINLRDELKSFLGTYVDKGGKSHYFMAHCRGDRRLDFERLRRALGCRELPNRLDEEQINHLGLAYGLVNPFGAGGVYAREGALLGAGLLQIFDTEVLIDCGLPGTMMTNAGDLTWAVEFDPRGLIESLPWTRIESIAVDDPENPPRSWGPDRPLTIGIITGNAPESGVALWNKLNARVRTHLGARCLGDISMPQVIVHSLPAMGLTMELDERHETVWAELGPAAVGLADRGANAIAIACNTSQYFVPRLREVIREGVEIISLPEVIAQWLRSRSLQSLALVGIRYVSELGVWSGYRDALRDFEVEPLSPAAAQHLHELAYRVKSEGATHAGLSRLRHILNKEVKSECVVLALTELSLLLETQRRQGTSGKLMVDPLDIYAEALACRFLGLNFPSANPATGDPA